MPSKGELTLSDIFIDSSFSEMSLTNSKDVKQQSTKTEKDNYENVVKKICKERQNRKKQIKSGAPIYFGTDKQFEIVNFYDDISQYIIKKRKRSSSSVYRTILSSLKLYCTQIFTQTDDEFFIDFFMKWLNDMNALKEYINNCGMTCEEKVKFHETVILLTLHAATIDMETLNLDNIGTLIHFIYFNTNDDRIFEFFNITVCDEFSLSIPNVIMKIYNKMNFRNIPKDIKYYCRMSGREYLMEGKEEKKERSLFLEKPYNFGSQGTSNSVVSKRNDIGKVNISNKGEGSKLKEIRRKKIEDLLITCGDESSSRFNNSYLLKLTDKKKHHNKKKFNNSLPTDFSHLVKNDKSELSIEIPDSEEYINIHPPKVLVPGTPEKVLCERNLSRKRRHSFSNPLSISNNNSNRRRLLSIRDNKEHDSLQLRTPRNYQNDDDCNKSTQGSNFSSIVLETPPHKIKNRRLSKELIKISDLARKNICQRKKVNNSILNLP
uniref:EF-hand_13 domain-containing protein n=1 Tax=Strongyloides venezuelensis TaxID=75913 RepID=A0A0K0F4V5_STRVS